MSHPREAITSRALIVWGAAVLVYVAAITSRTSFGVAGVEAIDRFDVDASRIAVFTAVQVGVYALAQIPNGMLIDRFGPRALLVSGAIVMGIGQVLLGWTDNYGVAIGARVLIGAGDATTFLSVMRILPLWFPLRKTPLFTQLTSSLGQLGQFLSAIPFLALLHAQGWVVSFVSLGVAILIIGLAASVAVADAPDPAPKQKSQGAAGQLRRNLVFVLTNPVCWHGFFVHYMGMVPQVVFTMLWGMPLMTLGMGMSSGGAGLILTLNTVAMIVLSPVLGLVSGRLGARRNVFALAVVIVHFVAWVVFFASPDPRSVVAMVIMTVIMGVGTPTSNFGFDYIRERLAHDKIATGTGLANMGGFVAGMVAAQVMGVLLDHSAQGAGAYGWADFRHAWWAVTVVWALGIVGFVTARVVMNRGWRGFKIVRRQGES